MKYQIFGVDPATGKIIWIYPKQNGTSEYRDKVSAFEEKELSKHLWLTVSNKNNWAGVYCIETDRDPLKINFEGLTDYNKEKERAKALYQRNHIVEELKKPATSSAVEHPQHYGGADNPYEAIKVIQAWDLNFALGSAVKYIARAGKKGPAKEDLEKAVKFLQFHIDTL